MTMKALAQTITNSLASLWRSITKTNDTVTFTGQQLVDLFGFPVEENELGVSFVFTTDEIQELARSNVLGGEETDVLRHRLVTRLNGMMEDVKYQDNTKLGMEYTLASLQIVLDEVHKEDIVACIENIGDSEHMVSLFATIMEEHCKENGLCSLIVCDRNNNIRQITMFDKDDPDLGTDESGSHQPPVLVMMTDDDDMTPL